MRHVHPVRRCKHIPCATPERGWPCTKHRPHNQLRDTRSIHPALPMFALYTHTAGGGMRCMQPCYTPANPTSRRCVTSPASNTPDLRRLRCAGAWARSRTRFVLRHTSYTHIHISSRTRRWRGHHSPGTTRTHSVSVAGLHSRFPFINSSAIAFHAVWSSRALRKADNLEHLHSHTIE